MFKVFVKKGGMREVVFWFRETNRLVREPRFFTQKICCFTNQLF